ncbi:MAG: hypothetical protein JRF65_14500, partial [Deltaproteobacteria bacterium]|nr:hypothetical protein [Deltaproteobacteria bacterium]
YTFAYPNGTPKDYTDETVHLLKCMNIRVAVTTTWGPNDKDTPLTALKRCGFDARVSPAWFRVQTKLLAMPPERRALINSGLFRSPIRRLVRQWRRAEG